MLSNQRVKELVSFLKENKRIRNQQDFVERIGSDKSTVSQILSGKLTVPNNMFDKIRYAFPDISSEWLLSGEGEMLKDGSKQAGPETRKGDAPKMSYTKGVPYYNVDFIGGFDIVLNDQTTVPEYLIDFRKYNEATCWCNVTGHSMEPEITHGDIIALKRIEDFSFLPFGEVYAIITDNGMRTIKRIGPAQDKEYYSLIPANKSPEYGIQELRKDKITHIFQVLGCMKRL